MKRPLYAALAGLIGAYHRCLSEGANESQRAFASKHRERIEALAKNSLPSGSGIDSGTTVDLDRSTEDRLVLHTSYHHMRDGCYDGWTEHDVIVHPSLLGQVALRFTGRDRNEIKDYLYDVFDEALRSEVEYW